MSEPAAEGLTVRPLLSYRYGFCQEETAPILWRTQPPLAFVERIPPCLESSVNFLKGSSTIPVRT